MIEVVAIPLSISAELSPIALSLLIAFAGLVVAGLAIHLALMVLKANSRKR